MKSWRFIGIILLIIAILYLPFLGNAFISDDIQGLVQLAPTWNWYTSLGLPIVVHLFSFFQYILYHVFGMVPWPYRLLNIFFHAGTVIFIYLIGKKLVGARVAKITALLFAVHPLVTESVVWISGGNYAQHTFFLLVSLWLYVKKSTKAYIGALVFFLLCVATSEKTVSLFLIYPAYEWFFGSLKKNGKRMIPFVVMSGVFIAFYALKINYRTTALSAMTYQTVSGFFNPFIQIPIAISSYIALFVWPAHLTLYHADFVLSQWNFIIRAVVTILFFAFLIFTLVKRKPMGFWVMWFLIGLAPTLTPLKVGWIVAERYAYLSVIGLCVLAAMLFDRIIAIKKVEIIVLCVGILAVVALSTRTVVRNSEWRNQDSLWVATLRESPTDPKSWNNMGDVYSRRGDFENSIKAFTQATKINPDYADAYHNIGNTYIQMKKYDEAIPYFEKAVSINPSLWQSYQDLAAIYEEKGEREQAVMYLDKAVKINPALRSAMQ